MDFIQHQESYQQQFEIRAKLCKFPSYYNFQRSILQNFIDIIDENTSSGNTNDKNVELPIRTVSPDIPHNMDADDTSFEEDFSESIESLADENISNLPEAEDWENDDGVPLFNNDRFDPSEDVQEDESQLEIPALQRFLGRIKGN